MSAPASPVVRVADRAAIDARAYSRGFSTGLARELDLPRGGREHITAPILTLASGSAQRQWASRLDTWSGALGSPSITRPADACRDAEARHRGTPRAKLICGFGSNST